MKSLLNLNSKIKSRTALSSLVVAYCKCIVCTCTNHDDSDQSSPCREPSYLSCWAVKRVVLVSNLGPWHQRPAGVQNQAPKLSDRSIWRVRKADVLFLGNTSCNWQRSIKLLTDADSAVTSESSTCLARSCFGLHFLRSPMYYNTSFVLLCTQ